MTSLTRFEIDKRACKIVNVNLRTEIHGPDEIPAVDVKFEMEAPADILAYFGPQLRQSLYQRDPDQAELPGVDPALTVLRNPFIKTIALDYEVVGAGVTIGYGVAAGIELALAKVGKFKLEAKEGGTVKLTFVVQAQMRDDGPRGRLGGLLKHTVDVTATPPEPAAENAQQDWPFPNTIDGTGTGRRGKRGAGKGEARAH